MKVKPQHRSSRRTSFRPRLEVLEDRTVLATLLWVGGENGNWSNAGNWKNISTNANKVPAADDYLIFSTDQTSLDGTPGTNTVSVVDEEFLTLAKLRVDTTYTSTITLKKNLGFLNCRRFHWTSEQVVQRVAG